MKCVGRAGFWIAKIVFWSLLAWPVVAEDVAPPLLLAPAIEEDAPHWPTPGPVGVDAYSVTPESGLVPFAPADVPEIEGVLRSRPAYWIASSRCSVQNIRERSRGPWGVQLYERHCDGSLQGSHLSALAQQVTPGCPVVILVHGSFVKWEGHLQESHTVATRLSQVVGGPLQMIFYSWPSDGPYTHYLPLDVAVRGRQADFNGFHLAWLIANIPASCPVVLIGHSHGARVTLSAMHLAGGGAIESHHFPHSMGAHRRYRVVLAAAALDHDWLNPGQQFDCALNRCECLLNLRNRHDLPLSVYPLHRPFARRALARAGVTARDAEKIGWQSAKLQECDVTPYLGHSHLWPDYYQQPQVLGTIAPYLRF